MHSVKYDNTVILSSTIRYIINSMHDWAEQDYDGKQGGQSRNIEFKVRKRNVPLEKEHLYAENMQLRAKLQDAVEMTTRLKTQLAVVQKEKEQLCSIAEEEIFHPKLPVRGTSAVQKRSLTNISHPNKQTPVNAPISRDIKSIVALKQMVRSQREVNQQLQTQMQRLKKTLKNTRVNELTADNKELLEETLRLRKLNAEAKQVADLNLMQYTNELQFLKKKLAQQREQEKRSVIEARQHIELNAQLKQRVRQGDIRRVQMQKKLTREIKELKKENQTLRIKVRALQAQSVESKPCIREECIKLKKECLNAKRKNEHYQKEIKQLNRQVYQLKQRLQFHPATEIVQKKHKKNIPSSQVRRDPFPGSVSPAKEKESYSKSEEKERVDSQSVEIQKPQLMQTNLLGETDKTQARPKDKSESADTEKLLEVLEDQPNLKLESFYHKEQPESSQREEQFVQANEAKQTEKLEEYQVQFEPQKQSSSAPQAEDESQEEVLFRKEEQPQEKEKLVSKQDLKMIRETLLYKFKAQGYTFDDFTRDLSKSGIKKFPVNEVAKMLVDQPFLLGQKAVECVLLYLFERNSLTGEEKIAVKAFTHKMKKFIGKAGALDESRQNQNIFALRSILEEDEEALFAFKEYCSSKAGLSTTITKAQFIKGMKSIGVDGQLLETALAQQVYVSEDIQHLDYQQFLEHLTSRAPEEND